ncbi:MAG: GNAT family N-acetyltransferase [Halieaceae bacterium]
MQSPPKLVLAADSEAELLADIFSDAFADDPVMNWVIPYTALYPGFYKLLASGLYLKHNMVYRDSESRAAAMWLPPAIDHKVPMGLTQLWLVLRLVLHSGPGILKRLEQVQEVMIRRHPRQAHYYLHAIGARRANQGEGLGSALIKQVTRICDAEKMPAYLESSSPMNVPLYERHGFEVQAEEAAGKGGPPLYFMWREPRSE